MTYRNAEIKAKLLLPPPKKGGGERREEKEKKRKEEGRQRENEKECTRLGTAVTKLRLRKPGCGKWKFST